MFGIKAKLNRLFCLLIFLFSIKCSNSQEGIQKYTSKDLYRIVEVAEKKFPLDSLTGYYTPSIQVFESKRDTSRYLCILNEYENSIYIYSYESSELFSALAFEINGPNGVGKVNDFLIHNYDSIFLLSEKSKKLSIVDSIGRLKKSYPLFLANPVGGTNQPIIKIRNKLYITNIFDKGIDPLGKIDLRSENLKISIDINDSTVSTFFSYPKSYANGIWGPNMLQFYYCYNSSSENFIYSFSADPYLFEQNNNMELTSYLAQSKYFSEIKPMQSKDFSRENRIKYFLTTPDYNAIIFDKFRNVYYRFAHLPISSDDLSSRDMNKSRIKHTSVIILDADFNKIGENLIPRFSYTETMFFVTREGLHLGKWETSINHEDTLTFGVFQLEKVK